MKIKRVIIVVLVLCMIISSFASCAYNEGKTDNTTESSVNGTDNSSVSFSDDSVFLDNDIMLQSDDYSRIDEYFNVYSGAIFGVDLDNNKDICIFLDYQNDGEKISDGGYVYYSVSEGVCIGIRSYSEGMGLTSSREYCITEKQNGKWVKASSGTLPKINYTYWVTACDGYFIFFYDKSSFVISFNDIVKGNYEYIEYPALSDYYAVAMIEDGYVYAYERNSKEKNIKVVLITPECDKPLELFSIENTKYRKVICPGTGDSLQLFTLIHSSENTCGYTLVRYCFTKNKDDTYDVSCVSLCNDVIDFCISDGRIFYMKNSIENEYSFISADEKYYFTDKSGSKIYSCDFYGKDEKIVWESDDYVFLAHTEYNPEKFQNGKEIYSTYRSAFINIQRNGFVMRAVDKTTDKLINTQLLFSIKNDSLSIAVVDGTLDHGILLQSPDEIGGGYFNEDVK